MNENYNEKVLSRNNIHTKKIFYSSAMIFNKAFDRSNGHNSYDNEVCGKRQRFFESKGIVSSIIIFRQVPY